MLHIFSGEDEFSVRKAAQELIDSLGPGEALSLNVARLSGEETSVEEVSALCNTPPFLAPARVVVLHGLLSRLEGARPQRQGGRPASRGRARKEGADGWERLAEIAATLPATTTLILTDGPVSQDNPLLRSLAEKAEVRRFPFLRGRALAEWVRTRVAQGGGSISEQAVRALVEAIGGNLWAMDGEVEKLLLYCGGRRVELEDVTALVSSVKEESLFGLGDAAIAGRYREARTRLRQALDGGIGASQIVALLGRQVRMLIAAQDLAGQRVSRRELEEALGTRSNFAIEKAQSQAKRFSSKELVAMHRLLFQTDVAIKTGTLQEDIALELLLTKLCGVG